MKNNENASFSPFQTVPHTFYTISLYTEPYIYKSQLFYQKTIDLHNAKINIKASFSSTKLIPKHT